MVSTLSSISLDELLRTSLLLILTLLPHQGTYSMCNSTETGLSSIYQLGPFLSYNWSHLVNSFVFTFLICKLGYKQYFLLELS